MTIEAVADIAIRFGGQVHRLKPGQTVDLPSEKACLLLQRAPGKVRPVVQPGATITWEGADLIVRHGIVDFVHVDSDGLMWAFVTMPNGLWAAVNLRMAKVSEPQT